MARLRLLVFALLVMVMIASVVRIRYQKLGWGGYWYVEIVPPWQP
ncbi:MAG TPA: hypothetical protein VE621_11360 [Bryobacteraceae bacterium]|nr:hypothetical protein [Bryobacteraceae bacterium]